MFRYVTTLLIYALIFAAGCNSSGANSIDKDLASTGDRVYEVFGMDCPGCQGGLEKLVKKIPAVESAKANWVEKQLVITAKPETELKDEVIYDAIKRANFTPGKRIK